MKKIHTRIKRKKGLSRHFAHYHFFHPGLVKKRPKTFSTEEAAHAWALNHGLKKEGYYLKKVKKNKRFQIVQLDVKDVNHKSK